MMASGGGSSISTPLPVFTVGSASPSKGSRNSGMKKTSASELLEQIRQLEIEGQKLRTSNLENLGVQSMNNGDTSDYTQFSPVSRPTIVPTSPSTLSALVDITAEQKTISDLRHQLDAQRKETDKLQQQLLGEYSTAARSGGSIHTGLPSSPSKTGFSTLPSTELFAARRPTYEYGPPSHLEKALKDSQEQVGDLRRRLQEATELSEQQKRQFRVGMEEMKSKLQEAASNRDALLDLRSKESTNQESLISKLQYSIQQLQEKVQIQEEALTDSNRKIEGVNREKYLSDTALNQVRMVLADVEKRRGKPYFESDPASKQVPGMLVHTLERCVQEFSTDSEQKRSRVTELEAEVKELKQNISQDKESLIKEQQEKITSMTSEQEKQIQALQERATNARKQSTHLQQQLTMLEEQHKQQITLRDTSITELENKVKHLKEEHQEDRVKWQEKKEAYERSLHDVQKEMAKMRTDRDEGLRSQTAMETRYTEMQLSNTKLQAELESEKKKNVLFWEKESSYKTKQMELESKLDEKQRDNERLEKMVELIKNECNAQVSEKITSAERIERERHLDQVSSLTTQLTSLTEKCNRVTVDLELNRSENTNLKQQIRDVNEKLDSTRIQLEAVTAEKKHFGNMLSDKKAELDRLSEERDYYGNLLEQKNEELAVLKGQKEKVTIQMEEKEKNLQMLQQQSSNFSSLVESNNRTSEALREEKNKLMEMLNERTVALEELKNSRETMSKKMKLRERRIKELEEEKQKTANEMQLRHEEMSIIQQEKDNMYKELKESRYEVATLTEEKDNIKIDYDKQISAQNKEISKLQSKVKAADQDIRLAQKALRTRESADHQAVKVADKMQKEVTMKRSEIDALKTKLRVLEDKVDSLSRERNSLENDKDRLKTSLNKTLSHNQQLSAEFEVAQNKVLDLKTQINTLEMALEKSATKNATAQAELEQYQQEMACLKLRHQLDLQEALQKSGQKKNSKDIDGEPLHRLPQFYHMPVYPLSGKSSNPPSIKSESRYSGERDNTLSSLPTRDTDEYKYVGSELKSLLDQMKSLIADKKEKQAHKASHHRRSTVPVQTNLRTRDSTCSSSDTEYHSDVELERSLIRSRSRTRSNLDDYSGFSSIRDTRSRSLSPQRRCYSNDTTQLLRAGDISYTPRRPLRETYTSEANDNSKEDTQNTTENTAMSEQTEASTGNLEEGRGTSTIKRVIPDTQDLCRRLEEKIESLTKMGGTLQKENKEMADLMKVQGKKLKKAKESHKKVKRTTR